MGTPTNPPMSLGSVTSKVKALSRSTEGLASRSTRAVSKSSQAQPWVTGELRRKHHPSCWRNYPSTYPSIHPSIDPSSINLCICRPIDLWIYPSIHTSIDLYYPSDKNTTFFILFGSLLGSTGASIYNKYVYIYILIYSFIDFLIYWFIDLCKYIYTYILVY